MLPRLAKRANSQLVDDLTQRGRQLGAAVHAGLAVAVEEVHIDRLDGHEQALGDLPVRQPAGRELDDPQLARSRLGHSPAYAWGDAAAAGGQLAAGELREWRGAARLGPLEGAGPGGGGLPPGVGPARGGGAGP